MIHPPRSLRQNIALLAATYGAWLATLALGGGIVFVWSGALRELYLRLRLSPWSFALYHNTVALVLILAWIVLAVAAEGWFRHGAAQGRLGRRFAGLALAEGLVLLAGFALLRLV